MISEDLVESRDWNAGQFIRILSKLIKGGGGGQSFYATAGGSDTAQTFKIKDEAKSLFS